MKKSSKHRGFAATSKAIAKKQGIPLQRAQAILASAGRKASQAARRANKRLNKISGMPPMSAAPKVAKSAMKIRKKK